MAGGKGNAAAAAERRRSPVGEAIDFRLPTRIVVGAGSIARLGELAAAEGGRRVLVVSDPGIVAAGHVDRGLQALREAGLETHLFDGAGENPTTDEVEAGVAAARAFAPDLLVGLGGGSSLDCAKGINFLLTNGGRMHDYWGIGKATRPMLPMIGVPTTAGTGSELQSFALISDARTKVKMACGDKKATCRAAVLDPELTRTQPPAVTALTGIDALSHALESHVTRTRSAISQLFSREAWRLVCGSFSRVLRDGADLAARGSMQLGAALGGLAIENSMLGAAHALANPLTARFGVAHGQAVGVMLPHVIRFNAPAAGEAYAELARELPEEDGRAAGEGGPADRLALFVVRMLRASGLAASLEELGLQRAELAELAERAAEQWTAGHNPRAVDRAALHALYESAWAPLER